jgi:hypothetical protein
VKTIIYVEILPGPWPNWRRYPYGIKVGRVRKRAPRPDERHLFTPIEVEVDEVARYDLSRGVTVTT